MQNQNYFYKSNEQLVLQAKNKNYKALEELVKRVQRKVYTSFLYLTKSKENLPDLTQEALIKMIKGLPDLKNPKSFNAWLNHIVMNIFYDNMRKKQRKPETFSIEDDENFRQIPDKYIHPLEKAINSETDRKIHEEISGLPDNFRLVIILRELQGLTYEEIANITNTNINTVKSRIARAREKLQFSLRNYI